MREDFILTSQKITHEELPGKYTYSCGWQKGFDVFIQARQHGGQGSEPRTEFDYKLRCFQFCEQEEQPADHSFDDWEFRLFGALLHCQNMPIVFFRQPHKIIVNFGVGNIDHSITLSSRYFLS